MSRTGDAHRIERGFTLLEMMAVLGILALVTAMILPMMTGAQSKADVEAAAKQLVMALRSTRNLAMMRGHSEALLVDTGSGFFRVAGAPAAKRVPGGVQLSLVTATQEQISDRVGGIRFFADGSSTGGGIRVAKGKVSDQVLIDWLTGRVSIGDGSHATAR